MAKLAKSNSQIAAILSVGNQIQSQYFGEKKKQREKRKIDGEEEDSPLFVGERFPSYFRLQKWNSLKGIFRKDVPQNSYVRIKFETDVQNDYLNEVRGKEKGEFTCDTKDMLLGNVLRNGILTATIKLPANKIVGESFVVSFQLTQPYGDPFEEKVEIRVTAPQDTSKENGRTKEQTTANPPKIVPVYERIQPEMPREEYKIWDEVGGRWDANKISEVRQTDESSTVYINMDSGDLIAFLKRQPNISEPRRNLIIGNYKIAILLYSIVYKTRTRAYLEAGKVQDADSMFDLIMQGISSIILDLIIDNKKLFDSIEDDA